MFVNVFVHNQNDYWSLRHKITVHTDTKLVYINSAVTEFDIKIDLYSDLKEWFKLRENSGIIDFPIRSIGGDPTITGQFAGDIYFMVNGWRVVIDLRKVAVTGVLFSDDYASAWLNEEDLAAITPIQVSSLVTSVTPQLDQFGIPTAAENASATATAVWEEAVNGVVAGSFGETIKQLAYKNMVSVSQNNGVAGTLYPIGTPESPVSNIPDALLIAASIGTVLLKIEEDIEIPATVNLDGYHVSGHHATKNQVTVLEGASTNLCQFDNINLTGNLDGQIVIRDSVMEDIIDFQGVAHQCLLIGTIELCGNLPAPQQLANAQSFFLSCYSGYAGTATPEIDMDVTGYACVVRDYSGGIKFVNKAGADPVSIDFNSGTLILDGTVTGGEFNVRGTYELIDNSGGTATILRKTNLDEIERKAKLAALNIIK